MTHLPLYLCYAGLVLAAVCAGMAWIKGEPK